MRLPAGFRAGAVAAGLKPSGNTDVGMIVSDRPAIAAGVFTKNRVQAAPVRLARRVVRTGQASVIAANAGNANACTGPRGMADARAMQTAAGAAVGRRAADVVVASTGIIGVPIDRARLLSGLTGAAGVLGPAIEPFADAIMTTDTTRKVVSVTAGGARFVGVAKGAGMIAPEMATMLAFVVTDADLAPAVLESGVREASGATFDTISVDGCTSTNDTFVALANGAGPRVRAADARKAIGEVCAKLARLIVEDGEGATRVVDIDVSGARTAKMASACARAVAGSVLFRCAVAGGDPNWGRILAALGAAGQLIDPDRIRVEIGGVPLCVDGARGPGSLAAAERAMAKRNVRVAIDLGIGRATARVTTNDLTTDYVRINAEYTT